MEWTVVDSEEYVNIKETLFSGQVFNFIQTDEDEYTGVVNNLLISFRQDDKKIEYKLLQCEYALFKNIISHLKKLNLKYGQNEDDYRKIHSKFFNEDFKIDFAQYLILILNAITAKTIRTFLGLKYKYEEFVPNVLLKKHSGLRLIKNTIFPTIFSFICSQNNNINRITKMVQMLYSKGEHACKYKDKDFFFFPRLKFLCDIENELKDRKFGYRSTYITYTASKLLKTKDWEDIDDIVFEVVSNHNNNENPTNTNNVPTNIKINFIEREIEQDKESVRKKLLSLLGVGPKVADCILLMGFGFVDVVPIDTHILKYSLKTFNLKMKNLNKITYKVIQDAFITKFGEYAGIVQIYIFKSYL